MWQARGRTGVRAGQTGGRGGRRGGQGGHGSHDGGQTGANAVVPVYKTGHNSAQHNWTFNLTFMQWHNGVNYAKTHCFLDAELNAITPNCVCGYIKSKAYGDADANPDIHYSTAGQSASSFQHKKSISNRLLELNHQQPGKLPQSIIATCRQDA